MIKIKVMVDFWRLVRRMVRAKIPANIHGPAIRAADPWALSAGKMRQLLSEEERVRLALLASLARFNKGEEIYREGQPADTVFNVITGVVKTYKTAPDGGEHIAAFLFPDDIFGLAEEGKYTNSAKAITPLAVYRFPVSGLRNRLARDPDLEFHFICKLIHELRETQRHAFLLAQRRALSRVVMFLHLLENLQVARGERTAEIYLPMNRSDIGEYLGMSLEAVSRAFRGLTARGIIKIRDRQHLKIADRSTFDKIAADMTKAPRSTTR